MSTRDKFEEKLRRRPTPIDVTFNEYSTFLIANGFRIIDHNTHNYVYEYRKYGVVRRVTCAYPHRTSACVKPAYIRQALDAVDEVRAREED